MAVKKTGHGHSIGNSTSITVGLGVILAGAIFTGGWWASGIERSHVSLAARITSLEQSSSTAASNNIQQLTRLITIETLLKTIDNRLERVERDGRNRDRTSLDGGFTPN